jgi:competence CoiA-like predicted nuclease
VHERAYVSGKYSEGTYSEVPARQIGSRKNTYWKQCAHVEWLMNGDHNTRGFHASATQRKRVNKINRLRQENGVWVEEPELNKFIA